MFCRRDDTIEKIVFAAQRYDADPAFGRFGDVDMVQACRRRHDNLKPWGRVHHFGIDAMPQPDPQHVHVGKRGQKARAIEIREGELSQFPQDIGRG